MKRIEHLEHLEHLDKELVDELTMVARETIRDELREQTGKQRRTAALYAASGAAALYAGAALVLALGLALASVLPGWAAALIAAAVLGTAAYALRGMARPAAPRPTTEHADELTPPGRVIGGGPPASPPGGMGVLYPPIPSGTPEVHGTGTGSGLSDDPEVWIRRAR
ncbi:phage holin family protein [Streptomyces sp. NPDC006446]|uniref:phage holin family protein n=1 Tax=Streptomyces sp. NPDC006446 TaxID=3154301 RepID=UPI0033BEC981